MGSKEEMETGRIKGQQTVIHGIELPARGHGTESERKCLRVWAFRFTLAVLAVLAVVHQLRDTFGSLRQ